MTSINDAKHSVCTSMNQNVAWIKELTHGNKHLTIHDLANYMDNSYRSCHTLQKQNQATDYHKIHASIADSRVKAESC
jgi:hypothetical protein